MSKFSKYEWVPVENDDLSLIRKYNKDRILKMSEKNKEESCRKAEIRKKRTSENVPEYIYVSKQQKISPLSENS